MKGQNGFEPRVRLMFQEAWECWECGMNTADSGHHIVGRGEIGSKVESSALNFAPLCNFKCHLPMHGRLRAESGVKKLLNQTLAYLKTIDYVFTDKDRQFMAKYKRYYSHSM